MRELTLRRWLFVSTNSSFASQWLVAVAVVVVVAVAKLENNGAVMRMTNHPSHRGMVHRFIAAVQQLTCRLFNAQ